MRYFYYFCRHSLIYQATFYFFNFSTLEGHSYYETIASYDRQFILFQCKSTEF